MTTVLPLHLLGSFDGAVRTDNAALDAAAGDFGGIHSGRPAAVLEPSTINAVAAAVRFARTCGVKIAVRGRGHTTCGQAQVRDGLIIDTSRLVRSWIDPEAREIVAEAGLQWDTLVRQTLREALVPPVLTDYLGLSVGGTLSVGGIGGQSFRAGAQTDNVVELTVVTGTGEILTCSAKDNSELFDACRAGLGQFGVIVQARLRLVPAPSHVRLYKALYTDAAMLLGDQERIAASGHFDCVQGSAIPNNELEIRQRFGEEVARQRPPESVRWLYQLKLARAFDPGHGPEDKAFLASLSTAGQMWTTSDLAAFDFANRMAPDVDRMRSIGLWQAQHPYLSVFLPEAHTLDVLAETLGSTTHEDLQHGPILIQVLDRSSLRTPNLSLPAHGNRIILLNLLRNASSSAPWLIETNRRIYERCRLVGGTLYPIGSVPLEAADWVAHYSSRLDLLQQAKQRFDPDTLFRQDYGPATVLGGNSFIERDHH